MHQKNDKIRRGNNARPNKTQLTSLTAKWYKG